MLHAGIRACSILPACFTAVMRHAYKRLFEKSAGDISCNHKIGSG
ncbi:hypothetical protein SXCC_01208 [Gluconacetobacter sp. SXCC-1]|nr:hypothetical protein SXCC_01208 [Gluconacetobacter sp. SXCC-1]